MAQKQIITRRTLQGTVVSNSMAKTLVVLVERRKKHPKYGKYFTVSKRYKVHDEKNQHAVGEVVRFVACRPISKDKRWRVLNKEVK